MDLPLSTEDVYAAQREEFFDHVKTAVRDNQDFIVHGQKRLTPDEMARVLHKIKNNYGFSRRERGAFQDAGFALDQLFPHL